MHVVVFLQYYHTPDCPTGARPYSLIERLVRNHQVSVLTTRTWYERRITQNFPWGPAGVDLQMFDVPYQNEMSPLQRSWSYLRYAVQALTEGLQLSRPDVILGSSTPLSAAMTAAAVARFRDIPWIFEVRDLWPDFPIQMGALSNPVLIKGLRALERWLYRSAAHVITLSPDMETHVRQAAPESAVTTIEYGTEFDLVDQVDNTDIHVIREIHDLPETGIVLYAGTFGRANAIPALLQTARRLRDRSGLCFVFAGHGYHEPTIRAAARELPNVRLVPPQPRPRALALFRLADVSICSFIDRPVLATNAPSKLLDSLAVGTPVIVTNSGWTRRLVEQHDCGWYVPPEDPDALSQQIETLFDAPEELRIAGERAAAVARDRFDRAEHMDRLARIVASVGSATAG